MSAGAVRGDARVMQEGGVPCFLCRREPCGGTLTEPIVGVGLLQCQNPACGRIYRVNSPLQCCGQCGPSFGALPPGPRRQRGGHGSAPGTSPTLLQVPRTQAPDDAGRGVSSRSPLVPVALLSFVVTLCVYRVMIMNAPASTGGASNGPTVGSPGQASSSLSRDGRSPDSARATMPTALSLETHAAPSQGGSANADEITADLRMYYSLIDSKHIEEAYGLKGRVVAVEGKGPMKVRMEIPPP